MPDLNPSCESCAFNGGIILMEPEEISKRCVDESDMGVTGHASLNIDIKRYKRLFGIDGVRLGDRVGVGERNGGIGSAVVTVAVGPPEETSTGEAKPTRWKLGLNFRIFSRPPMSSSITLIIALCRMKVFARVLQTSAALGIKRIHVINTHRVEPDFWQSNAVRSDTIQKEIKKGLESAGDTNVPTISLWQDTPSFLQDVLPRIMPDATNLVAHPFDDADTCPYGISGPCNLLVGPEGGFLDDEVDEFLKLGFSTVSLVRELADRGTSYFLFVIFRLRIVSQS